MSENAPVTYISLPSSIIRDSLLTASAKLTYGAIAYHQQDRGFCWPAIDTLATMAGLSRKQITRGKQCLIEANRLEVELRYRRSSIYRLAVVHDDEYVRIPSTILHAPITPGEKIVWGFLNFAEGINGESWHRQTVIGTKTGTPRRSLSRCLQQLEAASYLQVDHVHGGLKQHCVYRVTTKGFSVPFWHTRSESRAPKRPTEDKTFIDVKRKIYIHKPLKILSNQPDREAMQLLYRFGVSQKAATRIVYEQHTPLENIKQAVQNAAAKEIEERARGNPFKMPGYVVRTLEGARNEVKTVKPSKLCRDKQVIDDRRNQPPKPRSRHWLANQKRLLGVA